MTCTYVSDSTPGAYLVVLPVAKEINRAVPPPLQHGPAAVVEAVLAPNLDQPLAAISLEQVHPAGGVTGFPHLETVLEWT